jgi:hypothetical protein
LCVTGRLPRHAGALGIKLFVNGKLECIAEAVYGGTTNASATTIGGGSWETITSYKPCLKPIKVAFGDVIKMSAMFDMTKRRV